LTDQLIISKFKSFNFTQRVILPRYYFSDFTLYGEIILEIKALQTLTSNETKQVLNYLAASKNKIGLLVNFGGDSLKYNRIIL
jgi:GxxExxY protein